MSRGRPWARTRFHAAIAYATVAALFGTALSACSGDTPHVGSSASAAPSPSPGRPMGGSPSPPAGFPPWAGSRPNTAGHLAAGSDPSALPGDLLIADKLNNRIIVVDAHGRIVWQFPRAGDLTHGQKFLIPDDAFFSPDGRQIIATEEDYFVISVIDIATHRIVYRYGTPGVSGTGANKLDNPDDAMLLPGGSILSPDIKNCRILLIPAGAHRPVKTFGTTRLCRHNPPHSFGSPNGAFPMANGDYLTTEINGDWVDELSLGGKVRWSVHPPGVAYPSDTNEVGPDRYLTVDYATPGQVVVFNRAGATIWRYRPHGRAELRNPSLALPLPNGDVIVNDDFNHRVIVIDPRTNSVVWQYGHTGTASSAPGYLDNPDGIDLAPPYSLLTMHAATSGHRIGRTAR